jgi:hypothetical protein
MGTGYPEIVPFVAYVHAEDPGSPPPKRPAWEPNWRVWRWVVAAVVVTFAATRSEGVLEVLLVFTVLVLVCRAALDALPDGDGLREYRQ